MTPGSITILNNMTAGILIGHGELPAALQKTVEKIIGAQEHFQVVSNENCSAPELKNRLVSAIQNLGNHDTIIFVDLFGGSNHKIGIICGVNIGTLIKFFQYRDRFQFPALMQLLEETGKNEIKAILP